MKQGRLFGLAIVLLAVIGCAGSPYQTGREAERNRANLFDLKIGLTKDQVRAVMGTPYKTESYAQEGKNLDFWLYLTEGKSMSGLPLSDTNFTPLAFENGILKGWGRNYYDTVLRIKKDITIEQK